MTRSGRARAQRASRQHGGDATTGADRIVSMSVDPHPSAHRSFAGSVVRRWAVLGSIASAMSVAIAGCAFAPRSTAGYESEVDNRKVEQIERSARANGVQVYWVRYPQRNADVPPAVPASAGR